MAASTTRVFGKDLATFTVASQDIRDIVQECTVGQESQTTDVTVLRDGEEAIRHTRYGGRISFTIAYDTAFASQITALRAAVGTSVSFDILSVSGGLRYLGTGGETAMLLNGDHDIPDGGQTLSFELAPDGTGAFS